MSYERNPGADDSAAHPNGAGKPAGPSRFASLTAGLLARKGEAAPALEPFANARMAPGSAREMARGERHHLDRRTNDGDAPRLAGGGEAGHAPHWELPRLPAAPPRSPARRDPNSPYTHEPAAHGSKIRELGHHGEDESCTENVPSCPRKAQAAKKPAVALRLSTHDYLRLRLAAAELETSAHDIILAALDAYLDAKGVERFDECLCLQKTADLCGEIAGEPEEGG